MFEITRTLDIQRLSYHIKVFRYSSKFGAGNCQNLLSHTFALQPIRRRLYRRLEGTGSSMRWTWTFVMLTRIEETPFQDFLPRSVSF